MERFLIVCGAGAVGCGTRYLVSLVVGPRPFPYATLIVNLVGSFLIALVHGLALRIGDFSPELRLGLTTGFMGGLTTYSAFNYETTSMILDGRRVQGLANIGATVLGCLGAGLLGTWVAS